MNMERIQNVKINYEKKTRERGEKVRKVEERGEKGKQRKWGGWGKRREWKAEKARVKEIAKK